MWIVQKLEDSESAVLLGLSGRIAEEQLMDLQDILTVEAANRKMVLDLEEVKIVGQSFVTFFARCEAGGTELRNCPPYIREWITRADL
jgi:anti-anti-sigma regulatory factor